MTRVTVPALLIFSALTVSSATRAAAAQPDLYPNAYLKKVGPQQAQDDINSCQGAAMSYTSGNKRGMMGDTARGAARGAAKGAVAGAIFNGKAGKGAGAGAAVGGMSAAGQNYRENKDGSPEFKKYVEACLEDKGYKVVGWK